MLSLKRVMLGNCRLLCKTLTQMYCLLQMCERQKWVRPSTLYCLALFYSFNSLVRWQNHLACTEEPVPVELLTNPLGNLLDPPVPEIYVYQAEDVLIYKCEVYILCINWNTWTDIEEACTLPTRWLSPPLAFSPSHPSQEDQPPCLGLSNNDLEVSNSLKYCRPPCRGTQVTNRQWFFCQSFRSCEVPYLLHVMHWREFWSQCLTTFQHRT